MYWEGMKCPICKEATGFKESRHGGLKKPKIELVKKKLEKMVVGNRGKERE